jgi:thymidylate kinase
MTGQRPLKNWHPTTLTDYPDQRSQKFDYGIVFIILDAPVEISQARLRAAGKDLQEKYHTIEDLTHYKQRFLEVADYLNRHGHETNTRCFVIDASPQDPEVVFNSVLEVLKGIDQ